MMKYVRACNSNDLTEHSLLDHVKEVSDDCKSYIIRLRKGQTRIKYIAENFLSVHNGQINNINKIGKGFINIKPFLFTKKEAIYGFNARYMECRFSILQNDMNKSHYHLLILINYNSKLGKYIFWLSGLVIRAYITSRINKAIRYSK